MFTAVENLVGYSAQDPKIFKVNQLEPIKDLKLLVKDYSVYLVFMITSPGRYANHP